MTLDELIEECAQRMVWWKWNEQSPGEEPALMTEIRRGVADRRLQLDGALEGLESWKRMIQHWIDELPPVPRREISIDEFLEKPGAPEHEPGSDEPGSVAT